MDTEPKSALTPFYWRTAGNLEKMNPESVSIRRPVPLGLTCVQPALSHAGETSQHFQELWIRTTLGMYFHHKHNKLV